MTNKEILQADMLDILFEHRNKNYGAYTLRRDYNNRMGFALGIALSVVMLFVFSSFLNNKNGGNSSATNSKDSVVVTTIEIPKKPEVKSEIKTENIRTIKSVNNIVIVPDDTPTDVPIVEEIETSVVGTENKDGDPLKDPNAIVTTGPDNSGLKEPVVTKPTEEFIYTSSPAHFPGGVESWLNFLRRYLQSPDDLEAGQRVEVQVKFWIDIDGSLSRFEIVKSGGSSFDKEVLRVMKKMPKWEAATQNKNKVSVSFTQPVIFVGAEE